MEQGIMDLGQLGVLREVDDDETNELNQNLFDLLNDMVSLRELMVEFGLLTVDQGQDMEQIEQNSSNTATETGDAVIELRQASGHTGKRREMLTKLIAILGGTGIGSVGFLLGPVVGVISTGLGGVGGWFITRNSTVERLERLLDAIKRKPSVDDAGAPLSEVLAAGPLVSAEPVEPAEPAD